MSFISSSYFETYLEEFINQGPFDNHTFNEVCNSCEVLMNSKITLSHRCQTYIQEEPKKAFSQIYFLQNLKFKILNHAKEFQGGLTFYNILNNRYPFIKNHQFNFQDCPTWVNNDNNQFIEYYKICLETIYNDDIINVLDDLLYIESIQQRIDKLSNNGLIKINATIKIAWEGVLTFLKKSKEKYFDVHFIILANIVLSISYLLRRELFVIEIPIADIKAISTGIVGAIATILGFSVLFLGIAFENLKKTFGIHANAIFFKSKQIKVLFSIVTITIILGLLASILTNGRLTPLGILLFNLSILNFLIVLALLFLYSPQIIRQSNSASAIESVINNITYKAISDFHFKQTRKIEFKDVDSIFEKNEVYKIREIINNNLLQKNFRLVNLIIHELQIKLSKLLVEYNDQELTTNDINLLDIIEPFQNIYNTIIKKCIKEDQDSLAEIALEKIHSIAYICARKKVDISVITAIFNNLKILINDFQRNKNYKLLDDALWKYYHWIKYTIEFNCPRQSELDFDHIYISNNNLYDKSLRKQWEGILKLTDYDFGQVARTCIKDKNYTDNSAPLQIQKCIADAFEYSTLGEKQIFRGVRTNYLQLEYLFGIWLKERAPDSYIHLPINYSEAYAAIEKNKLYSTEAYSIFLRMIKLLYKNQLMDDPYDYDNKLQALGNTLAINFINNEVYKIAILRVFKTYYEIVEFVNKYPPEQKELNMDSIIKEIDSIIANFYQNKNRDVTITCLISNILFGIGQLL